MTTRRQERVGQAIKREVCDIIANHLNDPRLTTFVSITRIEVAANLQRAEVYLSFFGGREVDQNKTFIAIQNAKSRIRALLSKKLQTRYCPVLKFHKDEQFKKTLEIMKLINKATEGLEKKDLIDQ